MAENSPICEGLSKKDVFRAKYKTLQLKVFIWNIIKIKDSALKVYSLVSKGAGEF